MKYKISIANKDDPLFFEKVGDKSSSRKEILKNLINTLKKNGWKIKGGSNGDS